MCAQGGPAGGRGEAERGQGYRKLWQQVTKVGRGQKLGEGTEATPFSDMTVEDLLRIVRSLPPEESAVAAVSRGLFYLDSRALAALLKELHKVGLSNRCACALCPCLLTLPLVGETSRRQVPGRCAFQSVWHAYLAAGMPVSDPSCNAKLCTGWRVTAAAVSVHTGHFRNAGLPRVSCSVLKAGW